MEQSLIYIASGLMIGLGAVGAAIGVGVSVSYTHLTLPTTPYV